MEIMINKDGKIDYFTLPVGKDDYQRMYKIKPSHYGTMKTQNETNESAGGDFIRTDGDGKYAESFGAESLPQTLEDCKKRLGIAEEVLSMSDAVKTYNKYLLQEMGIDRYAVVFPINPLRKRTPSCGRWDPAPRSYPAARSSR